MNHEQGPPDQPTGHILAVDPDTGIAERMAYWLPAGVTPEDIGLEPEAQQEDAPA